MLQNTSKTKVEILQTVIDNTCFYKKKHSTKQEIIQIKQNSKIYVGNQKLVDTKDQKCHRNFNWILQKTNNKWVNKLDVYTFASCKKNDQTLAIIEDLINLS